MIRTIVLYIFVAVGYLFFAMPASAEQYVVSDSAELDKAIKAALPGDTIVMKNGTWKDTLIRLNGNSGEPGKEITLRAETGGKVILTGTSRLRIGKDYWVVDGLRFQDGGFPNTSYGGIVEFRDGAGKHANYSRLTNTQMIGYNPPNKDTDYKWVSLFGTHNRVDHSHFEGKNHAGALLVVWRYGDTDKDRDYHQIDNNYFGKIPVFGKNGAEAIRIGTSEYSRGPSNTVVESNLFEEANGEAEIISVKSWENIIRYNTLRNSQGGIVLRHGDNSQVYGNYIFGGNLCNTVGIRIIGYGHKVYNNYISGIGCSYKPLSAAIILMNGDPKYNEDPSHGELVLHTYKQARYAEIVHNTLVNNKNNVHIGVGSDGYNVPPDSITIANNVIYGTTAPLVNLLTKPTNMTYKGNVMFGAELGITPVPEGITMQDPAVAMSSDGLFRPSAASPVKDKAQGSFPYVDKDMDGQSRDSSKDVGADELSASKPERAPLSRGQVGPSWLEAPPAAAPAAAVSTAAGTSARDAAAKSKALAAGTAEAVPASTEASARNGEYYMYMGAAGLILLGVLVWGINRGRRRKGRGA
ncbi:polysaccharide lyase 6 family protein [Paenibacillus allorhizosphaerae]|uniref:Chondroitinase-B n=1 Tax=Paenibacillus allorhizosphaerae TaxID=2849866 RepID=A0ABM8VFW7_9BACL|nr:polysaccharide lyase 6 family protein [Paenibacillus allorhizosphaerae]CAG7636309.1 Chondroitinase-B [Paenibacillus allorhizosphaerae]